MVDGTSIFILVIELVVCFRNFPLKSLNSQKLWWVRRVSSGGSFRSHEFSRCLYCVQ